MSSKDKETQVTLSTGSDEVKTPSGKSKKPGSKKVRKSFGWFIGVLVLIVISIMFIIPATAFNTSPSKIVFGKYDGQDIALENGNFFYNQLNTIAEMYSQQYNGAVPTALYPSIYYQAFQNGAIYTAINRLAEKAKIESTTETVQEAVLESGYWNNSETGAFDVDRYNSATKGEKDYVARYFDMLVPYTTVIDDAQSAKLSEGEISFIRGLSSAPKSFEYLIIDSSKIDDESVREYANLNMAPFMKAEVSPLNYTSEDEAQSAYDSIADGSVTFEEAEESSIDPTGITNNTPYMLYEFENLIGQENADSVFDSSIGSVFGPYSVNGVWTLYRLDTLPSEPDLNDADTLDLIRDYMDQNDREIVEEKLGALADEIYAAALEDFDKAESDYGLLTGSALNVSENPGNSSFIYSLTMADVRRYLSTMAENDDFSISLFNMESGDVMKPVLVDGAYIITRALESTGVSPLLNAVTSSYQDYAGTMAVSDFEDSVMRSNLLEDRFAEALSKYVIGNVQ